MADDETNQKGPPPGNPLSTSPMDYVRGITFHAGDFVSLFSLFFDNLSTLLGLSGAILGLIQEDSEGGTNAEIVEEVVFQRIIPSAGIMLFFGNVYYTFQAIRMSKKYGREYTAQPYGLNTSGGFPFIFGIMYGVFFSYECAGEVCTPEENNDRFITCWQVCVAANFTTGLINIGLGFCGQIMMRYFPLAAMLVPLAGIGFTWLALNQIAPNFADPAIGLIPVFLIFTQYYAKGRFHLFKGFYMPEAIPIVLAGGILGWATGTNKAEDIQEPVAGGAWAGDAFIEGYTKLGPYIGTVLPFSIAASFGDMMCLVSAQKAGDPFPITETMVSDGIGTLIGAILGSPFGTVVYIGHPVHKKVGARTGYSIMNGAVYLVLCLSGVIPSVLSIVPTVAIGPIIFIFGMMICEECTLHIAQRHHSAIFFGIFFGVCDYIYTNWQPVSGVGTSGQLAMSRGSALSCMLWCSIIVYTIDRRWLRAAFFCCITAFFAGLGIIHQAEAVGDEFLEGTGGNFDETSPFRFMMGYLSLAGVCVVYWLLQKYMPKKLSPEDEGYEDDHGYLPPIEEPGVDDMFDTWWDPVRIVPIGDVEMEYKEGKEVKKGGEEEIEVQA